MNIETKKRKPPINITLVIFRTSKKEQLNKNITSVIQHYDLSKIQHQVTEQMTTSSVNLSPIIIKAAPPYCTYIKKNIIQKQTIATHVFTTNQIFSNQTKSHQTYTIIRYEAGNIHVYIRI